jgi:hypothetical protein
MPTLSDHIEVSAHCYHVKHTVERSDYVYGSKNSIMVFAIFIYIMINLHMKLHKRVLSQVANYRCETEYYINIFVLLLCCFTICKKCYFYFHVHGSTRDENNGFYFGCLDLSAPRLQVLLTTITTALSLIHTLSSSPMHTH